MNIYETNHFGDDEGSARRAEQRESLGRQVMNIVRERNKRTYIVQHIIDVPGYEAWPEFPYCVGRVIPEIRTGIERRVRIPAGFEVLYQYKSFEAALAAAERLNLWLYPTP